MGKLVRVRRHVRSHLLGYVALFLALSVAPAWALAKNSVFSRHITNGQVKTVDLKNRAVKGPKVALPLSLNGTVNNGAGTPAVPKSVLRVTNAGDGRGIIVRDAGSYGVEVGGYAGDANFMQDAFRILETGDDGLQVGLDPNYPNYGLYVPSPGVSTYGLWSNTSNASGQWALFSVDNISAGNLTSPNFAMLGRVAPGQSLRAGQIVTALEAGAPFPGSISPLARMGVASGSSAVVGVVESRMVAVPNLKKNDVGLRSARGPARAGDYVALTIAGVADVRVAKGAQVKRGDRLAVSSGAARLLRTTKVNGIRLSEDASTVGIALGRVNPRTNTVRVFVMPR